MQETQETGGLIPGLGRFPLRRKWQPTSVFLPGESRGQSSVVGYSPGVSKNQTEANEHTHTHTHTRTAWTLDFLSEVGTMCQHSLIHDHFFNIFICLASRFLVVAGRIFSFHSQTPSCSLWDLVLWSGVEPRPAALTAWSLCHGTTREVPYDPFFLNPHVYCQIPPETCTCLKTITLGTHSYEYGNMLKTFTFHSFYYSYHWPLENICIWCM